MRKLTQPRRQSKCKLMKQPAFLLRMNDCDVLNFILFAFLIKFFIQTASIHIINRKSCIKSLWSSSVGQSDELEQKSQKSHLIQWVRPVCTFIYETTTDIWEQFGSLSFNDRVILDLTLNSSWLCWFLFCVSDSLVLLCVNLSLCCWSSWLHFDCVLMPCVIHQLTVVDLLWSMCFWDQSC